jgi:hypothetical protein
MQMRSETLSFSHTHACTGEALTLAKTAYPRRSCGAILTAAARGKRRSGAHCDVEEGRDDKCKRSPEDHPVRFGASLHSERLSHFEAFMPPGYLAAALENRARTARSWGTAPSDVFVLYNFSTISTGPEVHVEIPTALPQYDAEPCQNSLPALRAPGPRTREHLYP